jgi:hypothetical protein
MQSFLSTIYTGVHTSKQLMPTGEFAKLKILTFTGTPYLKLEAKTEHETDSAIMHIICICF